MHVSNTVQFFDLQFSCLEVGDNYRTQAADIYHYNDSFQLHAIYQGLNI